MPTYECAAAKQYVGNAHECQDAWQQTDLTSSEVGHCQAKPASPRLLGCVIVTCPLINDARRTCCPVPCLKRGPGLFVMLGDWQVPIALRVICCQLLQRYCQQARPTAMSMPSYA